jgi:phosphoenolpyruvate---glycerone phosphotransferase subunit DhaL
VVTAVTTNRMINNDQQRTRGTSMISELQVRNWIDRYRLGIHDQADELNKLDAALGDGDFGASMQRGLAAVAHELQSLSSEATIGEILRLTGTTIVSSIGGTSGPLVGSFFLKAGLSIGNKNECDLAAFAAGLRAGANAVMDLGGSAVGDKTMLDALVPAIDALDAALEEQLATALAAKSAAVAASVGADATRALAARRGRASYVGNGGIGLLDPGAQGVSILFDALSAVLAE